jgi:hypothetical protein
MEVSDQPRTPTALGPAKPPLTTRSLGVWFGPQNSLDAGGEEGNPLSLPGIECEHVGRVTKSTINFAHV